MKKYQKHAKWIAAFVFATALIAVYKTFDNLGNVFSFFGSVMGALTPFITGFVIAYILNIPCRKIEGLYKKVKIKQIGEKSRGLSILSVYILFILIVTVVIRAVIPSLYSNIVDLSNNIIPFSQNALKMIDDLQKQLNITIFEINETTVNNALYGILNSINISEFGKYAQGAINFTSGLLTAFIALIISIYLLIDWDRIVKGGGRLLNTFLSENSAKTVKRYILSINDIFSSYIYCCVLDAAIVACLATIALSIVGVKYSIIFGTLIGLCNLIPYFGAMISNSLTIVITIFTGGWLKALWAAVVLFVLSQLDGNLIGPKIMGSKLDVRPLWIIFAVTFGGGLFGVVGMLVSVPAMMVIRMIASEIIANYEEKKALQAKNQE